MSTENEPTPSTPPAPSPTTTEAPPAPPSLVAGVSPPAQVPAQTDPVAPPTPPQPAAALTAADLKFAEGFQVADTDRDAFLNVINDANLSRGELAQKLIDLQAGMSKTFAEAQEKAWTDAQEAWSNEVRSDPEIGGDKLDPILGKVSQLIDKYGSPELRGIFTMTNAGNSIHMVRFLSKIANDLVEGGPVSGAPSTEPESLAKRLFPSMK